MRFAYKRFANGIERPIIPIIVRNLGTRQSVRYQALVDSGADECIFAAEIGELIGLDVLAGRERNVSGVIAGQIRPYYVHDVEIEIGGTRRRSAVGFMPDLAANGHGSSAKTVSSISSRSLSSNDRMESSSLESFCLLPRSEIRRQL
jgi:predicted aspartyl protease